MKLSYRLTLALLLVIAFAARFAVSLTWQTHLDQHLFGMADSESYWALGQTIAEGKPYAFGEDQARVFRTPGYPILLAPVIRCFGEGFKGVFWARAEAALFGVLAVAGVWWLTRLLFDDSSALLAAALATFYPGAVASSVLILSEAPFCPLLLLNLGLWIKAWQAPTKQRTAAWASAAGIVAGLATLVRPSWLLFTPFAAIVGLLIALVWKDVKNAASLGVVQPDDASSQKNAAGPFQNVLRRHAVIACWMLLALMLTMSPWWIRNAWVTGHFIPTTLQVGASLYDGLNPEATGASNMDFVDEFTAQERKIPPQNLGDSLEIQLDRRMRSEAIRWAQDHPGRVLQLAGIKFLRMWNFWPNEARFLRGPIPWVVFFTYTPILFFAIMGAWRTQGRGWPYMLCWLPAVYLTLLHMVFVSSIRYREPAMLALLAFAAAALCMRRKDSKSQICNQ